ncbi:MAG: hypothetical protein KDC13_05380 [Bacteroidetes bacterium]|nr:hypothetical protein [Bacteroidota bacterium]
MANIYFNGPFDRELESKYLTVYTNCINREQEAFLNEIAESLNSKEIDEIKETIEFGKSFSYGTRKVDEYYFSHALRIARLVYYNIRFKQLENLLPEANGMSGFCSALRAALIHNSFEKNLMSRQEFAAKFGQYYCDAVDFITVDREAMKTREGVLAHYRKLATAPEWVLGMRALDKADNLLILHVNPDEQVKKDYLLEIENDLIPLLKKGQPELAALLADECAWAGKNKHHIPDEKELSEMKWSYLPYSA